MKAKAAREVNGTDAWLVIFFRRPKEERFCCPKCTFTSESFEQKLNSK
jgi:hypothetical protein